MGQSKDGQRQLTGAWVWCRAEEGRSNAETSLHTLQKQFAEQAQELQKLRDSQLQAIQTHADAASTKELGLQVIVFDAIGRWRKLSTGRLARPRLKLL